jgi:hypothetical protein
LYDPAQAEWFCAADKRAYLRIEPARGGEEAWEKLVAECRARGLRQVITSADAPLAALPLRAARVRLLLRPGAPQPELDGAEQEVQEVQEVHEHLIAAAVHSLRRGCDGFPGTGMLIGSARRGLLRRRWSLPGTYQGSCPLGVLS